MWFSNVLNRRIKVTDDKLLHIESMPQIKLGFTQMGLDDVNHINKYIDDNVDRLPDLSSSLVGQIKQNEKSKQLEFDLTDLVPKKLGDFFIMCAKEYAAAHPLSSGVLENIGPKEDYEIRKMWSVHSYAGDYNPMHEHGTASGRGVSMIVFLKVPPQIAKLEEKFINPDENEHGNLQNY